MTDKKDIKSFKLNELEAALTDMGLPKFRAAQIFRWLHVNGVVSFEEMTNLSKELRKTLSQNFVIRACSIHTRLVSKTDETVKYLFTLYDGEAIESVLMKYKYGYTLCVSTQVGCNMGCKFCASTLSGCQRNLSAGEILSQIHAAQNDRNIRISHVVLMGMGEPLDNFENVVRFLELVNDKNGLGISLRNVSLSTCGIVPKIRELETMKLGITLSVSLHAPNNEIRNQIMPINRKWNIEQLLAACADYAKHTSRRISFEYAMIRGVNDSPECAEELGARLKGMLAHVNLIPVNSVSETGFKRSEQKSILCFLNILEKYGVNTTVRRTLGSDINASCGQLRRQAKKQKEVSN